VYCLRQLQKDSWILPCHTSVLSAESLIGSIYCLAVLAAVPCSFVSLKQCYVMLLGNLNLHYVLLGSGSPVKSSILKLPVNLTFLDYDDYLLPAAV